MIMKLYAVKDALTGFMEPHPDISDASAMRNFSWSIRSTPQVLDHAADLDLFFVGEFDSDTGFFDSPDRPKFLMHGSELVRKDGE